jgi:hypothetical protein
VSTRRKRQFSGIKKSKKIREITRFRVLQLHFCVLVKKKCRVMSGASPESWDDQDMSNPMSKLNVNASEFVPSWGSAPTVINGPEGTEKFVK